MTKWPVQKLTQGTTQKLLQHHDKTTGMFCPYMHSAGINSLRKTYFVCKFLEIQRTDKKYFFSIFVRPPEIAALNFILRVVPGDQQFLN